MNPKRSTAVLSSAVLAAAVLAAPLLAGALLLHLADPQKNPEALAKHAVVMVEMTACRSPEKTIVSATAEGLVAGKRQSLPLHVIRLAQPGMFGVAREWPDDGVWTVRVVASNPEYKDFQPGLIVPVDKDTWSPGRSKQFFHAPSESDINLALQSE